MCIAGYCVHFSFNLMFPLLSNFHVPAALVPLPMPLVLVLFGGRVTWGMTAPGGKTVPPPVDNLKLPRTFPEYTECCYHLPDTCFERSTPRSRRTLKYYIFSIYTCSDVIFPYHYTCHSYLHISDNEELIYHANA